MKEPKVTSEHMIQFSLALGDIMEEKKDMLNGKVHVYTVEGEGFRKVVFSFQDMSVMVDLADLMTICVRSDLWREVDKCSK